MNNGLTHFSLCTGIGGLDLAAEWAGFTTVGQCETDAYASKDLAKNFPGVKNYGDIRTITAERLCGDGIGREEITVLSAGFPCQPYSLAGKGLGDSDSRDLWGEVARCIGELRPEWFVGENTPGLFSRENQRYFRRIVNDLSALGYHIGWGMWGACDVGANHQRKRVFIVAYSDGERVQGDWAVKPWRLSANTSLRMGSFISNAPSEQLGMFRSEKKITKITKGRHDYGMGAQSNASREWWEVEPAVGRVANGVPSWVDRLRCLGNAVVPQQAYPIFVSIAEFESKRR